MKGTIWIVHVNLDTAGKCRILSLYNGCTGADPGFDQGGGPDHDRPKTTILGPQFCRILVLGHHFWWSGGARAPPPGSAPDVTKESITLSQ